MKRIGMPMLNALKRRAIVKRIPLYITSLLLCASNPAAAASPAPSRGPVKGCVWEKLAGSGAVLHAWVQRCDFGSRRIDLFWKGNAIMIRYSDGGEPEPLVEVFDLKADETIEAGIKRLFVEHTGDKKLAARCVLRSYKADKPPAGIARYTFVPNAALQKEVDAKADPNEVGDPPCGDWGDAPDGIQYFEAQAARNPHRVLFVRVGQDEPLFDEKTLRLLPTERSATPP